MTTTRRTRNFAKVGAAAGGLGLAAVAVLGFSNAAFSAKSENGTNNWATSGSVTLEDAGDKDAVPLFSFGLDGAAKPKSGATQLTQYDNYLSTDPTALNDSDDAAGNGVRSIDLKYTGEPAADVRMYADLGGNPTDAGSLAAHTDVVVKRDGAQVWTGKLSAIPTSYAAASAGKWDIAQDATGASHTSTYTISISADAGAPAKAQVKGVKWIWEAGPAN
jgi:hypothetical protein